MIYKFTSGLFLFLIACFNIAAQPDYAAANNWENTLAGMVLKEQREGKEGDASVPSVMSEYSKHRGSPFYNGGVVFGSLISMNGDEVSNLNLLYDLFKNEIYYLKGEQEQMLIKPYLKEIRLEIDDKHKIFRRINPFALDRFYEILFEDDQIVLYVDVQIHLIEGVNKGMVEVAPKFTSSDSHMLIVKYNEQIPIKVNLKKRDLLTYLPADRAKACREFIKGQKKFKLKSEESYVKMLSNSAFIADAQ